MKKLIKENLQDHGWAIKNTAVVPADILYSEVFRSLTKSSTDVLLRFLQKRRYSKSGKGRNAAYSDENGHLFRLKAASSSDSKRPPVMMKAATQIGAVRRRWF